MIKYLIGFLALITIIIAGIVLIEIAFLFLSDHVVVLAAIIVCGLVITSPVIYFLGNDIVEGWNRRKK